MKKVIISLLFVLFMVPFEISASQYIATASGNKIFHTKEDLNTYGPYAYTSLAINISNVTDLDSLVIKVKYDRSLIGLQGCSHLYIANGGCPVYDGDVYFRYEFTEGRADRLNQYDFYLVRFMPKEGTPSSGTTNVIVEFENVKDKQQNDVYIEPLNIQYTFEPMYFKWEGPNDSTDSEDNNENNTNSDISNNQNNINLGHNVNQNTVNSNTNNVQNNNSPDTKFEEIEKSNNNFLKGLSISGYEIDFDKDKFEYIIEIDKTTDRLDITAELEDEKASVFIIGNENLSSNDSNIVIIKVTAEDGTEREYLIKTIFEEQIIVENNEATDNQTNNIVEIITYTFVSLVVLIFIILIIKNHLKKLK